jgi:predicted transposase YbfD/YdcC
MSTQTQVPSLVDALADVPDFRQAQGRRYELLPILLLSCVALLCGYSSQSAIAEWCRNYGARWIEKLGFKHGRGPSQSTLHRIFLGIDHRKLEAAITRWSQAVLQAFTPPSNDSLEGIAIDGKTARGSSKQGAHDAHLLASLSHSLGVVLSQVGVEDKTNEITKVDQLIESLVLTGKVITTDALLTQRAISQRIIDQGGDYLMVVKDNQPSLRDDIEMSFTEISSLADLPKEAATNSEATVTDEHGGRIHERQLKASSILEGHSSWPGLKQVLKLERTVTRKRSDESSSEIAFAITSLSWKRASAEQLLKLWREHWHIENKLHWVRDVTYGEDQSQVRAGHIPQVMAALRNVAISLLRLLGETNIAAACRKYAAQPALALSAVGFRE